LGRASEKTALQMVGQCVHSPWCIDVVPNSVNANSPAFAMNLSATRLSESGVSKRLKKNIGRSIGYIGGFDLQPAQVSWILNNRNPLQRRSHNRFARLDRD